MAETVAAGYAFDGPALELGGRHGLVAGATGTGKTKALQLLAEQLSAYGVRLAGPAPAPGRDPQRRKGAEGLGQHLPTSSYDDLGAVILSLGIGIGIGEEVDRESAHEMRRRARRRRRPRTRTGSTIRRGPQARPRSRGRAKDTIVVEDLTKSPVARDLAPLSSPGGMSPPGLRRDRPRRYDVTRSP